MFNESNGLTVVWNDLMLYVRYAMERLNVDNVVRYRLVRITP